MFLFLYFLFPLFTGQGTANVEQETSTSESVSSKARRYFYSQQMWRVTVVDVFTITAVVKESVGCVVERRTRA